MRIDRSGGALLAAPALLAGHRRENAVGLIPGVGLALGDDRPERNVEAGRAPECRGLGAEVLDSLTRRLQRLGVDGIDVAEFGAHLIVKVLGNASSLAFQSPFLLEPFEPALELILFHQPGNARN